MNAKKFEKLLSALNKKHFGKCTCCRKEHAESCHTFSGIDFYNKVQDVGYCCKDKLDVIMAGGVYINVDINTPEGAAVQARLTSTHPLAMHFSKQPTKTAFYEV